MAASLVHLPDVARLGPTVVRILGGNPGKFTLQGTNTYLVGQGSRRLLIDTGEGKPAWKARISTLLEQENATITHVLLTHRHHDHTGGVSDLLSLCPQASIHKAQPGPDQLNIANDQTFSVQGATVRAVHCPGHTTDHTAFVLEEQDALFTGDNILGQGTAVFEDLGTYMRSLRLMATLFRGRAYPGHGPVVEAGHEKVQEYISHRLAREEQILSLLRQGGRAASLTAADVVRVVYCDYPESLHAPAQNGVWLVLTKLEEEGRVERHGEGWTVK